MAIYDYLSATWQDEVRPLHTTLRGLSRRRHYPRCAGALKIFDRPNRVAVAIVLNGLRIFHSKYKSQFNATLHRQQISSKKRLEVLLACKRVSVTTNVH